VAHGVFGLLVSDAAVKAHVARFSKGAAFPMSGAAVGAGIADTEIKAGLRTSAKDLENETMVNECEIPKKGLKGNKER